jgi:hypothetical protein
MTKVARRERKRLSIVAGSVALTAAGLLSSQGVAAAAPAGQYGGPTSQKVGGSALLVTLTVVGGALVNVSLDAVVDHGGTACTLTGEGGSSFDFSKGMVPVNHHGEFDGELKDPNGESVRISGSFTGRTVTGSLEIEARGDGQAIPTCSSGRVTFTANAAGGQVEGAKYTGTVGPGYPISFLVSADGSSVDDLAVGIEATCQPGAGSIAPVYNFKKLAITSGTFSGGVFAQHGQTVSDSVRVSGTFFGRTAVGEVTDLSHIKSLPDCTESEPFTAKAA